jgi:OmpA-OmpF porin, OOP family
MITKNRRICLGILLIFMSACATPQSANMATGNPEQLVNQLETDLATARSNQLDVLAPNWFSKAQSSYAKAKTALQERAKLSDIGEYVAEANVSLKKAEETAQVSRAILGSANEARQKALKVGADKLGEPYMKVENQYLSLTQAIENNNMSYAQKNAAKVQAAFRDVEIMAIKHNALAGVRKMLTEAEKAKIQKAAPIAYADAEKYLAEADTYIGQHPYATEAIRQKADAAAFMARRMMSITAISNKFKEMGPEDSAIYIESLLSRLGKTMGAGDLRDKSVEDQINAMIGVANDMNRANESLKSQNQDYQAQVSILEQRLSGLQGYSRQQEEAQNKLKAQREFNERFNKVQQYFRPDEAEVYKQGRQLVIRLRGINFPVGQATLTPENYILLSKVQQAIRMFDQPTVTIEGHTDSTGSAQTNQELSQKRAEAVMTYLVANNTLPSDKIRASGYGPDRPLAPNTTPEGRAINRRIDVLITPTNTP